MTIKDEIENKIEFLWSEKTNIFGTGEPYGFSDCTNDILEIFSKLIDSKIKVLEEQRKDIEKTHSDDLQCNGITGEHLMIVGSVVELSKLKEDLEK